MSLLRSYHVLWVGWLSIPAEQHEQEWPWGHLLSWLWTLILEALLGFF
jgi:hypothetical protein